jgi:hypothetical protein
MPLRCRGGLGRGRMPAGPRGAAATGPRAARKGQHPQGDRPRPGRPARNRRPPGQSRRRPGPRRHSRPRAHRMLGEPGLERRAHHPPAPGVARRRPPDSGASGLVGVLVARQERRSRVHVCGWLVDVYCLGSRTSSARACCTPTAWPTSPAPSSPPTRHDRWRCHWTWPDSWCSAPSSTRASSASSPSLALRQPRGIWGRGPGQAPSASGATASLCSSRPPRQRSRHPHHAGTLRRAGQLPLPRQPIVAADTPSDVRQNSLATSREPQTATHPNTPRVSRSRSQSLHLRHPDPQRQNALPAAPAAGISGVAACEQVEPRRRDGRVRPRRGTGRGRGRPARPRMR